MNREIKFRAWAIANKQMFNPENELVNGKLYEIPNTVFMQYTGLKDKNGVEIYEGDIVKYDEDIEEVIFKNGAFTARHYTSYGEYEGGMKMAGGSINILNMDYIEVIGNIYEK